MSNNIPGVATMIESSSSTKNANMMNDKTDDVTKTSSSSSSSCFHRMTDDKNDSNHMISFISYGLFHCKSYSMSSIMSMIQTLDGRDKLSKLLQYMARFIAWYYMTNATTAKRYNDMKTSISNSRKVYRLGRTIQELYKIYLMGIGSLLYQYYTSNNQPSKEPLWKILGNASKALCLAGFWGFDNITYLAMSGFFSNANHNDDKKRTQYIQTQSTFIANRFYFVGAIIGLYVNLRSYIEYYINTVLKEQQKPIEEENSNNNKKNQSVDNNPERMKKIQEQQWLLYIALVKSLCDVTVFSNNPGVDLWIKYYGKKNHEGIHCISGMISSLVIIYQNLKSSSSISTTK